MLGIVGEAIHLSNNELTYMLYFFVWRSVIIVSSVLFLDILGVSLLFFILLCVVLVKKFDQIGIRASFWDQWPREELRR